MVTLAKLCHIPVTHFDGNTDPRRLKTGMPGENAAEEEEKYVSQFNIMLEFPLNLNLVRKPHESLSGTSGPSLKILTPMVSFYNVSHSE